MIRFDAPKLVSLGVRQAKSIFALKASIERVIGDVCNVFTDEMIRSLYFDLK